MSDYLINPRNAAFLAGESRHLTLEPIWKLLIGIVIGLMSCVPLVGVVTVSLDVFEEIIMLNQSGSVTQASIIDYYSEMHLARRAFYIDYQFIVDGRTIVQTERVSPPLYERLSHTDQVTLTFLPDTPEHARFSGVDTDIRFDYIDPICLPLVFAIMPSTLLLGGWQSFRERQQQRTRYQRLEKQGTLLRAKVLQVTSSQVWYKKANAWQGKVIYCLKTPNRSSYTRRLVLVRADQADLPTVGDTLAVLFVNSTDYEVL